MSLKAKSIALESLNQEETLGEIVAKRKAQARQF